MRNISFDILPIPKMIEMLLLPNFQLNDNLDFYPKNAGRGLANSSVPRR